MTKRLDIVAELTNPDSATITDALTRRCDICAAPAGTLCTRRPGLTHDLTGRLIHLSRMQEAR